MRAVHVHEPFADGGENVQRGGRAVDELAVRARAGEGAFQDELMIFAGFETILVKQAPQGRFEFCDIEDGFDGATVAVAADERAVGAFAEDEVERADNDGLARAGLAGDDVAAGLEFEREVRHEGEVFDAQRRQHG